MTEEPDRYVTNAETSSADRAYNQAEELFREEPVVPVMTDPWIALTWACEQPTPLTRETVEILLSRVGREVASLLLRRLWRGELLTLDALTLVGEAWSMDEFPERTLSRAQRRGMFAEVGYLVDGVPSAPPNKPIRLYRGSSEESRLGWSWTDDLGVARKYAAGGWRSRQASTTVWTAEVPPAAIFCRNTDRDEAEYVVDTEGLAIERLDPI